MTLTGLKKGWNYLKKLTVFGMILSISGFFIYLETIFFEPFIFVFTLLFTLALFCLFVALSARKYFSLTLVFMIIVFSETISHIKFEINNFSLHVEDLYYYVFSKENLKFLYEHFYIYLVYLALILAFIVVASALFIIFEKKNAKRIPYFLSFLLFLSPLFIFPALKERATTNSILFSGFYDRHLASFYISILEVLEFKRENNKKLAKYIPNKPVDPKLTPPNDPPHIILIHQESVIPPGLFTNIAYNKQMDDFYLSFDKKFHKMRVEIFAGTSWMTEFSIFAGLSPLDYGMKRPFVFTLNYGKLTNTITQQLKQLGYKNQHIFPLPRDFSNYDKFYESIGMDVIYDLNDFKIGNPFQRDTIYYNHAMKKLEDHFKTTKQPIFSFIQTMSAHFPYGFVFEPDEQPPATFPENDAELNEYLRRIWLSRQDYQAFKKQLAEKFPDKKFLLVHYGDHHPTVTRAKVRELDKDLLARTPDDRFIQSNSIGMQTYYVIEGLNYTPPALPDIDILDATYLGDLLLESAGLPLSDISQARKKLMITCKGRFFSCENQQALDDFHAFVSLKGGVK